MRNIIQQYFKGLELGDATLLILLFSENGIVHSPLYGDMHAKNFYNDLFADTTQSSISLLNIFDNSEKSNVFAAHFIYEWMLKDGNKTKFECVDIFQFDTQSKISELTIIYDTYQVRRIFNKLR